MSAQKEISNKSKTFKELLSKQSEAPTENELKDLASWQKIFTFMAACGFFISILVVGARILGDASNFNSIDWFTNTTWEVAKVVLAILFWLCLLAPFVAILKRFK